MAERKLKPKGVEVSVSQQAGFIIERTTPTGLRSQLERAVGPGKAVNVPADGEAGAEQVPLGKGEIIRVIDQVTGEVVLHYTYG